MANRSRSSSTSDSVERPEQVVKVTARPEDSTTMAVDDVFKQPSGSSCTSLFKECKNAALLAKSTEVPGIALNGEILHSDGIPASGPLPARKILKTRLTRTTETSNLLSPNPPKIQHLNGNIVKSDEKFHCDPYLWRGPRRFIPAGGPILKFANVGDEDPTMLSIVGRMSDTGEWDTRHYTRIAPHNFDWNNLAHTRNVNFWRADIYRAGYEPRKHAEMVREIAELHPKPKERTRNQRKPNRYHQDENDWLELYFSMAETRALGPHGPINPEYFWPIYTAFNTFFEGRVMKGPKGKDMPPKPKRDSDSLETKLKRIPWGKNRHAPHHMRNLVSEECYVPVITEGRLRLFQRMKKAVKDEARKGVVATVTMQDVYNFFVDHNDDTEDAEDGEYVKEEEMEEEGGNGGLHAQDGEDINEEEWEEAGGIEGWKAEDGEGINEELEEAAGNGGLDAEDGEDINEEEWEGALATELWRQVMWDLRMTLV